MYSIEHCEFPLLADWGLVINQWNTKTSKSVGQIMQIIEMMGLSEKQESAVKSQIKQLLYENANDALDWVRHSLLELVDETTVRKLEPDQGGTVVVTPKSDDV